MYQLLFIHPDPKFVRIYENHFRGHFDFDSAHDGLAALRKIRLTRPAAIISDFHLPYLSGLSLLKFVRATPAMASTPFIFLAAKGDIVSAMEFGANDWIQQAEAHPDLLLAQVGNHLQRNIRLLNLG